jgi:hypothetical protein
MAGDVVRVPQKRKPSRMAEVRRRDLIDAAIGDIATPGYDAVAVATICEPAGFSRGLIGHCGQGRPSAGGGDACRGRPWYCVGSGSNRTGLLAASTAFPRILPDQPHHRIGIAAAPCRIPSGCGYLTKKKGIFAADERR